MKVILLQDVAKIGKKHSVVDVPDGYGMNKLVPKGLAKPATKGNLKAVLHKQQEQAAATEQEVAAFQAMVAALADATIEASAKANTDGALYEALKKDALVDAIKTHTTEVRPEWVEIQTPIKSTGDHTVTFVCGSERVERPVSVVAA